MQRNSNLPIKIILWMPSNQKTSNVGNAKYEIDSRSPSYRNKSTKKSTKRSERKIMAKPKPLSDLHHRRAVRKSRVAKKRASMEKRKRMVHPLPESSPSFRPRSASSPKFSARHMEDIENWMNDEDSD